MKPTRIGTLAALPPLIGLDHGSRLSARSGDYMNLISVLQHATLFSLGIGLLGVVISLVTTGNS